MLPAVRVGFRLVDVFTEVPFAGNQLCVVPDPPAGLDADTMQRLAREIGFSETTFVTETGPGTYRMRIFTPASELPFAGHPTLGTAFTLVAEGRVTTPVTQTTAAGDVPVEIDMGAGWGWMRQFPPAFGPEFADAEIVARAAGLALDDLAPGLPLQVISTGLGPLLVPVRDDDMLRSAVRDDAACAEATRRSGGECLYLFAIRGDGDVRARMFDAMFTIGEDPATGSAAGPLGVYLASRGLAGMPGTCVVAQGEQVGRPSFIHLDVRPDGDTWAVRVGGGVRQVGEGAFEV
jgi:trans-2,3-dihydro-3-hydroxyanthranilate isomerase